MHNDEGGKEEKRKTIKLRANKKRKRKRYKENKGIKVWKE